MVQMILYHELYGPEGYCFLNEKVPRHMTEMLLDHPGRQVGAAIWGRPGVVVENKERPSSKRSLRRGSLITTAGGRRLFFDRAVSDVLEPLLGSCGEFYDVEADDGSDLVMFKADCCDALLEKRRLSFEERKDGLQSFVHAYSFDHGRLDGRAAFCLADRPLTDYFSDAVVQTISAAGLDGVAFRQVPAP